MIAEDAFQVFSPDYIVAYAMTDWLSGLVCKMPDNLTPEQRRYTMSRVKNRDTAPERRVRSALHRKGLRFRKHLQMLPGTPDIVFTRAKVVVFIDGDFWHGYRFRTWEHKLTPYWQAKITKNRQRDLRNIRALRRMGWRVVRVWTHEVNDNLPGVVARIERLMRTPA